MVFLWFFNGVSMFFQWFLNGFSMVFQWFFNGFSMVFQWFFNGFSLVRAKSAQRSHQMSKQQQDMRKTIANMERTQKNGSRNMFSIVGGYQGVAKIARDRTRTEQFL